VTVLVDVLTWFAVITTAAICGSVAALHRGASYSPGQASRKNAKERFQVSDLHTLGECVCSAVELPNASDVPEDDLFRKLARGKARAARPGRGALYMHHPIPVAG
jgi:hypothetical protein